MCDTIGGIRFCGCGFQSENPFVCSGAKPTQRAYAWDLPRDRKRTRKGRSQRNSQQKGARETNQEVSQEMRTGQRRDQSIEVRKAAARTCWPTDAGFTNARIWVSIPSGFVEVSRKYTPAIACKCTESSTKVSQTSPLLRLELTLA